MLNLDKEAWDFGSKRDERGVYNTLFDNIMRHAYGAGSITRRLGHIGHRNIAKSGLRESAVFHSLRTTYFP